LSERPRPAAKPALKGALHRRKVELRKLLTGAGRADPDLHREMRELCDEIERLAS
jgi:hypothetical protein